LNRHRALIIDSHPLWLDALANLLSGIRIDVVDRSTSTADIVDLVRRGEPDILVLGIGSGEFDQRLLSTIQQAKALQPALKTMLFCSARDDRLIAAAFAAGVDACCMKSAVPEDVTAAIRQSFERSIYLGALGEAVHEREPYFDLGDDDPELTRRESEILRLVAEGHSNAQLARMLWVTEQTVKFHLSNIYRKLNVSNRTGASRWAQRHGLLPANGKAAPDPIRFG
jgi:DNA-binding NarL/FixJ family response regulator